uniref:Uncharacterized protein n=1 Tax=Rhizophora mucronata TaxID=61149 RepID=A0A2P2Q5Q4_RHIMU
MLKVFSSLLSKGTSSRYLSMLEGSHCGLVQCLT